MKLTKLFLAAALITFAACEKKQDPQVPEGDLTTINARTAEVKTTTTDGVNVKWESGDEIALFVSGGSGNSVSALYVTDVNPPATTATFTLVNQETPVKQDNNYIAVYPSSQLYVWNSAGKKACSIDLPYAQTVSGPGWDKKATLMASSSTTNDFVFNHCVAYLKFTITEDSPRIVSFAASSAADGELIAARVKLTIADDNTVIVAETTPASLQRETATLTMEDEEESFPNGTYYLAILPKTYTQGFVFVFTDVNGKTIERRVEGAVDMQAGWVGNIGNVKKLTGSTADPLKPFDLFGDHVRVSIIGDSISTFEGTMPSTDFKTYYPKMNEATGEYYDVTSSSDLYWAKVIAQMTNGVLEVNNSWSGSMVSRRPEEAYFGVDYGARVSSYGLGKPNVILIHGGTNDCTKFSAAHQLYPNEYRSNLYDDGIDHTSHHGMTSALPSTDEYNAVFDVADAAQTLEQIEALRDSCSFVHAYVKLLTKVHFLYPDAKVVIIIGDQLTKRAQQVLLEIAAHYGERYGYKCVNFFGLADEIEKIASGNAHPSAAGHTYMANKIYTEVGDYIDIQKQ